MWRFVDGQHGPYRQNRGIRPGLINLLLALRTFEVYQPRDHVYGLLGLHQKFNRSGKVTALLAPDYAKSLADVLRDATRAGIEERQNLDYIRAISGDKEFPTWVPRWDREQDANKGKDPRPFEYEIYHAGGVDWTDSFVTPSKEEVNILPLRGFTVATVAGVVHPVTPGIRGLALLQTIETFRGLMEDLAVEDQRFENGDNVAIATTPVAAVDHEDRPASMDCVESGFRAWSAYISENSCHPPHLDSGHADLQDYEIWSAAEYDRALGNASSGRSLFTTSTGLIGLGAKTMHPGDIVTILYGCQMPVILQPCPHSGDYELVGASYVYGIMDGEAVAKHKADGIEDVTFRIR
ncbi:hypothetical protein LTR85_010241 [Meristemomyces frigidus]|nr:hypothetical protein LTR85_010241 [Meristemomyces frigidus]